MNKMLFAASFLPLAASAAPADPSAAVQQAFPAYSIDFRQAVLLAQVELKRAPADIATTADGIKTTLGGDKDRGNDKAGKGGDGYTQGGYKEQGKTAGAGKDKSDGYTAGGYKEQGKTAGAGKDKSGDGYTYGGYKEQAKTAGAGKDKSGDGYTAGGYKDQAKTAGAGKDKSGDGYTSGGYKEQSKTAGAGKDRSDDGYTSGGYKEQGKTAGAGKEAGAMPDEGSKALGGMKDHKDAGAGKMLADGYKTGGGFKDAGEGKALGSVADYMKSGRGAPPGLEGRPAGELKMGTTEGGHKWSPVGGIKGEDGAGAGKPLADGATTGGMKIDGAPKAVLMESPLGGKTPVAPAIPIEQPVKLAPLAVPGTPVPAPAVAPAVVAPQPVLIKSPTLVPTVLPTK